MPKALIFLAAQLGAIKWTVDSRGRIKIESKDHMLKRGKDLSVRTVRPGEVSALVRGS